MYYGHDHKMTLSVPICPDEEVEQGRVGDGPMVIVDSRSLIIFRYMARSGA